MTTDLVRMATLGHPIFDGRMDHEGRIPQDFYKLRTEIDYAEILDEPLEPMPRLKKVHWIYIGVKVDPVHKDYLDVPSRSYCHTGEDFAILLNRTKSNNAADLIGKPVNAFFIWGKLYGIEPIVDEGEEQ